MVAAGNFPHLFSPLQVGGMHLRNRVMAPPHASAIGNLWGSPAEADRNIAYWRSRAEAGVAWIDGATGHVSNTYIPGFEPSGPSAETIGYFRLPYYVERARQLADSMHAADAVVTAQLTMIAGVPHAPSARRSDPIMNAAPHVLNTDEIGWFVREYAWSASQAQLAGLDGIELHMNNDDLLEWFLSPLTNAREDRYGGDLENRARFIVEILTAVRDTIGTGMTLGVRMNLQQELPGGLTSDDAIATAQYLESTGLIEFIHLVVGSSWGSPSYIPPHTFQPGQWAELSGAVRQAVSVPVVHTGLVNSPQLAEKILAAGYADVVGMARAQLADGELLIKAREGRLEDIRPCVGGNDCISRRYVENLPFSCAVNPGTGHELEPVPARTGDPRRVLVLGGGPAGMEFAALARDKGHEVTLWERTDQLGGQLRVALAAPAYGRFGEYLRWQERRLAKLGVDVQLNRLATAGTVAACAAEVVAVVTGARSRRPAVPGADADFVFDIRDVLGVLGGSTVLGKRVLVIAEDDHMPPLSVADYLSERGHDVTVVYGTAGPAQLLGRYIVGGILGRLDDKGVQFRFMEQLVRIEPGVVSTRNIYSRRERQITGVDSVVLACGGVSNDELYDELRGQRSGVHVLGDAFAPRRLVFATRQAYALAQLV
jgi:2,4-dienoyl-CoA reductase-like NADH-dependent reductase (Old Yellow Enzyme family)